MFHSHRSKLTFPSQILLNCTDPKPGHPSAPTDLEQVRDYLITKTSVQKHYYDKRHNTRPLPDLSPRQDVLFLSLVDQISYLEGTIVSQANTPRSYIIEAQGHRYRCNRQHIKPMNTDPALPLARPYTHTEHQSHNTPIILGPQESTLTIPNTHTTPQIHNNPIISGPQNITTPQTHNNPIISGPQNISGPPQPHPTTRNIWNMKMPTLNDAPTGPQSNHISQPTKTVPTPDPT